MEKFIFVQCMFLGLTWKLVSNFCGYVSIFVFSAMSFKLDFELEFLGDKITVIETNLHVRLYSNCELLIVKLL